MTPSRRCRKFSISQVPVFDGDQPVGLITEDGIMRHLADVGETELKISRLSDTMDPVPPIVDYRRPRTCLFP